MPIPPTGITLNAWKKFNPKERLSKWMIEPSINFIKAFREVMADQSQIELLKPSIDLIQEKTPSFHIHLPVGAQSLSAAVLKAMNIIAKNFAHLSKKIHTTGGQEFDTDDIMWAAEDCIKNKTDEEYWGFVAQIIDKKILESKKKIEENNNT